MNVFVQQRTAFVAFGRIPWNVFQALFAGALLCGVVGGSAALGVLRETRLPRAILSANLLDIVLLHEVRNKPPEIATNTYDRAIVAHLLTSIQIMTVRHDEKAAKLAAAQFLFAGFLAVAAAVGGFLYLFT